MTDRPIAPQFRVGVQQRGSVATVSLEGELDIATAPRFEQALAGLEPSYETLVIDLSHCAFFASSGIAILLGQNDRAESEGFKLLIVKAPPPVQRMFDLAALDDRLTFTERPPA